MGLEEQFCFFLPEKISGQTYADLLLKHAQQTKPKDTFRLSTQRGELQVGIIDLMNYCIEQRSYRFFWNECARVSLSTPKSGHGIISILYGQDFLDAQSVFDLINQTTTRHIQYMKTPYGIKAT